MVSVNKQVVHRNTEKAKNYMQKDKSDRLVESFSKTLLSIPYMLNSF